MSTFDFSDEQPADISTHIVHDLGVSTEHYAAHSVPVYRASTIFFENCEQQRAHFDPLGLDYSYGLHGTPTQFALAKQLARIEQAKHALVVPSGLAAIAVTGLALLSTGDHWLIPDNAYFPTNQLARAWKSDFNIEYDVYDPTSVADFQSKLKPNTRLVWLEAPGSITFEVPDIEQLVALAKANGSIIAIDNTWSAGLAFKPFSYGIDVSIQALSKFQNGHADLLMGSITSCNTGVFARIESRNRLLGFGVHPDACSFVLRGLQTLPLRYEAQAKAGLQVAQWLEKHLKVDKVLHPAISSCPGHHHWNKLFTGSAGVFSFTLQPNLTDADSCKVVDTLRWFRIGYSWGGPESLALALKIPDYRRQRIGGGYLIRLSIGLENPIDLISDLQRALAAIE